MKKKKKFTVSPTTVAAATEAQLDTEKAIYKAVNDLYDIVADARNITDVDELPPVLGDIEYAVTVLRSKLANYTEFHA